MAIKIEKFITISKNDSVLSLDMEECEQLYKELKITFEKPEEDYITTRTVYDSLAMGIKK